MDDKSFNKAFRGIAHSQDEHFSTAMMRKTVHGIRQARGSISDDKVRARFDATFGALFEYGSAHRAPTIDTYFSFNSGGALQGVRHPAGNSAATFTGGGSGHSAADPQRADAVAKGFALAAANVPGVVAPFVAATAIASNVTLNTMMGPSMASNMSGTFSSDSKEQMRKREAVKAQAMGNPVFAFQSASTASQSATAPKVPTRSPSPFRN
jgi:hypothetical protein